MFGLSEWTYGSPVCKHILIHYLFLVILCLSFSSTTPKNYVFFLLLIQSKKKERKPNERHKKRKIKPKTANRKVYSEKCRFKIVEKNFWLPSYATECNNKAVKWMGTFECGTPSCKENDHCFPCIRRKNYNTFLTVSSKPVHLNTTVTKMRKVSC